MNEVQKGALEFHKKYGHPIGITPMMPTDKQLLLRARLISEEAAEFITAASRRDMVGMCDALADLLYVVYGTAVVIGVDMEPISMAVQLSNMTKDGGVEGSGKTMKGPGFKPPNIRVELEEQEWDGLCYAIGPDPHCH